MEIKTFNYLPDDAKFIRQTVFIDEQGFVEEFDDKDSESLHIVLYENGKPAGTCRVLFNDEKQCYMIGRVAVLQEYRKNHLGSVLLSKAEEYIRSVGEKVCAVSAQCRAESFYRKSGYSAQGDMYYEEYCPHIFMKKTL
ncbi:MAG: GNAT family N-acetyltransferase [Clostridia bacterium]|nr:GNAT family N-acetyltransferase [Clostridia bacterium]